MFDTLRLTQEQRHAAAYSGGHLLIVAGAGTGKTTALTARLAHLIQSGVAPDRILLLTFSRRAARELLDRAEQAAGRQASAAWGGTFHAIANRLLRRYGRALGLDPSFTVLDRSDTADLLTMARDEVARSQSGAEGRPRRQAPKHTLADILSRCINTMSPLSQVLREHFPWCADERAEIGAAFQAYTARKRSQGVLDYDDLLLSWSALLKNPGVAPVLQKKFDHILVDEYQDTNALQADLLEAMCAGGARLTAVGDDAQAIYSFRAATHANIMEFPGRFGAELLTLEQNHRSTPPLLECTNALIQEATRRHPKKLWSNRQGDARPVLLRCDDEAGQAVEVCRRVLEHHEQGTPLQAQAVLVRSAHHSDVLELEMTARNIPFVKYGGLKFLEAAHVKDLLCLLRLVENPRDQLAWFRALTLIEGVGQARAGRIAKQLAREPEGDSPTALGSQIQGEAEALLLALSEARKLGPGQTGGQVERIRVWLNPALERRYPNAAARTADLDQLSRAAAAAPSLSQFLADLTLDPPAATSDLAGPPSLDEDFITISTIHSAKGCEWDVVHVIHLADGHVPSDLATGDTEAIEEERRLLYVAMTRARNHLYGYLPLRYHYRRLGRDDAHGYGQLTRFFTPAVLACMQDVSVPLRNAGPDSTEDSVPAGSMAAVDGLLAGLWD